MDGTRIFIHAVRMVFGNIGVALRIVGVLVAIQLVLLFMAGRAYFASGMGNFAEMGSTEMMTSMQGAGYVFLLSVLQLIFSLWIAVAWHRYILLEEQPGAFMPRWNGAAIWEYFKAGFVLAIIVIIAVIPMMLIGGILLFPMIMANPDDPSMLAGLLAMLIIYLPAAYIAYRISPILPSASVGTRMTVKDAWSATSSSGASFVILAVVSVIAGWLLNMPASILARGALPLGLIWVAVAQTVSVLVGISILTTIYGHYVQKRDLNA